MADIRKTVPPTQKGRVKADSLCDPLTPAPAHGGWLDISPNSPTYWIQSPIRIITLTQSAPFMDLDQRAGPHGATPQPSADQPHISPNRQRSESESRAKAKVWRKLPASNRPARIKLWVSVSQRGKKWGKTGGKNLSQSGTGWDRLFPPRKDLPDREIQPKWGV